MFLSRRLVRPPPLNRRWLSSTPQRGLVYVRFGGSRGPLNQPLGSQGGSNNGRQVDSKVPKVLALLGAAGVAYYVTHLEQVPETGRWRFMNTSPEAEAKLGEYMHQSLRRELAGHTLPPHHPVSVHVRRIVSRILAANNLGVLRDEVPKRQPVSLFGAHPDSADSSDHWNPDAHIGGDGGGETGMAPVYGPQKVWNIIVADDKTVVNAMAVPGTIVVFTGILPVCQDEEGLAAVLSHEIGHVVARHSAERISSQTVAWTISLIAAVIFGFDLGITGLLQTYILELPNSRKQETEADIIGLRLMSKACYDPAASPKMFDRMARLESKIASRANLDFFQTHPSSEKRVKILEERLHEGYEIMAQNPNCDQLREQLKTFRATAHSVGFDSDGHVVVR